MRPLRFGLYPYLNVQPITWGLEDDARIELVRGVPSQIAERFRAGELDLAFVPSLEAAAMEAPILSSIAIGCAGPVETVLLAHCTPLESIRRIALDVSSRTSAALAQVLIGRASGRLPETVAWMPASEDEPVPEGAEAALVIGDPAFRRQFAPPWSLLDLGEEWQRVTQLPFVFAVVVAATSTIAREWNDEIRAAHLKGMKQFESRYDSERHGVSAGRAKRYLTESIRHGFGDAERHGLTTFLDMAREWKLSSPAPFDPSRIIDRAMAS